MLMILLWSTILCDAMKNSSKLSNEYYKEKNTESDINHQWQSGVVTTLCPYLSPKMIELILEYLVAPLITTEFTLGTNCICWSLSRDHALLYTAENMKCDVLRVWSTITGYSEWQLIGPQKTKTTSAAFSPDHSILAFIISEYEAVRIWNTNTMRESRTLTFHGFNLSPKECIFDKQGQQLMIACYSGDGAEIVIKDLTTGRDSQTFQLTQLPVRTMLMRQMSSRKMTVVSELKEDAKILLCTLDLESATKTTINVPLFVLDQLGILTHDGQYLLRLMYGHIQAVEVATGTITTSRGMVGRGILVAVSPDRDSRWVAIAKIERECADEKDDKGADVAI